MGLKAGYVAAVAIVIATMAFGAAADAAGTVIVYTAAEQQMIDDLLPAFEKSTGIKTEVIKAGSGELMNRLKAEKGKPAADVLWSVDGTVIDSIAELFEPYKSAESARIIPGFAISKTWTPFTAVVVSFIVNPTALGDLAAPGSWADLAKPEYKGKISSPRADQSGSAFIQMATVLQDFGSEEKGLEVYKGILGNAVLSTSSGAVPRFVTDGEYPIGITIENDALRYKLGGAAVEIVYPSEGTAIVPDGMAVVRGGPNTENGKLFIDFMTGVEAQTGVAKFGRRPVREDVPADPNLVPIGQITATKYDFSWAAANRSRLVEAWQNALLDVQ